MLSVTVLASRTSLSFACMCKAIDGSLEYVVFLPLQVVDLLVGYV